MPFEKITHVKVSKTGRPLSKNTISTYTTKLNLLSIADIDTIQALVDYPQHTIDIIDFEAKSDRDKRIFYSAIFYALHNRPLEEQRPYYEAFQSLKEEYNEYLADKKNT